MTYMFFPIISYSLFPSSLLFLQVDNRPCSRSPSTCFPYATEAANFLRAVKELKPTSFPNLSELDAVISIRGVREEIGSREEEKEVEGRLTCPVSHTRTFPALNFIQTKHYKTPLCFQCVHFVQIFRFVDVFHISDINRYKQKDKNESFSSVFFLSLCLLSLFEFFHLKSRLPHGFGP